MRRCCCGNVLDATLRVTVTCSPCRCSAPGPGRTHLPATGLPSWVGKRQAEGRRKLGLPEVTPAERAVSGVLR
jgi:hypothetical protein